MHFDKRPCFTLQLQSDFKEDNIVKVTQGVDMLLYYVHLFYSSVFIHQFLKLYQLIINFWYEMAFIA